MKRHARVLGVVALAPFLAILAGPVMGVDLTKAGQQALSDAMMPGQQNSAPPSSLMPHASPTGDWVTLSVITLHEADSEPSFSSPGTSGPGSYAARHTMAWRHTMVGAFPLNSLSELTEELGFRVSTNLGDTLALDSTIRCLICPLGVAVAAPVTTLKAIYEL